MSAESIGLKVVRVLNFSGVTKIEISELIFDVYTPAILPPTIVLTNGISDDKILEVSVGYGRRGYRSLDTIQSYYRNR